jgi:hypothetical protein
VVTLAQHSSPDGSAIGGQWSLTGQEETVSYVRLTPQSCRSKWLGDAKRWS